MALNLVQSLSQPHFVNFYNLALEKPSENYIFISFISMQNFSRVFKDGATFEVRKTEYIRLSVALQADGSMNYS